MSRCLDFEVHSRSWEIPSFELCWVKRAEDHYMGLLEDPHDLKEAKNHPQGLATKDSSHVWTSRHRILILRSVILVDWAEGAEQAELHDKLVLGLTHIILCQRPTTGSLRCRTLSRQRRRSCPSLTWWCGNRTVYSASAKITIIFYGGPFTLRHWKRSSSVD